MTTALLTDSGLVAMFQCDWDGCAVCRRVDATQCCIDDCDREHDPTCQTCKTAQTQQTERGELVAPVDG